MHYLTYHEHRAFTYRDLLEFEIEGKKCKVAYGTIKNKMNDVFKDQVQVLYYSPSAYYTLKDSPIANSMTDTHTMDDYYLNDTTRYAHICNHPLYKIIKDLYLGKKSIHDIRLRLQVQDIWIHLLSQYYIPNSNNEDICILNGEENNIKFSVTVHSTDTISISLGCTHFPIEIDVNGIMRLWNTFAVIEERLRSKVNCDTIKILSHKSWMVTMWHFSKDALPSYAGERFNAEFGTVKEILIRIYTKKWRDGKTRIRIEKQEYPMKTIENAIEEKLHE